MHGRIWAEIDLDRLSRNFHRIKKQVDGAKVLAAVKADAYGHGAIQVSHRLEQEGVDFFGVAGVEEGIELRESGLKTPIIILSPVPLDLIDPVFHYHLIPTISEAAMIERFASTVYRLGELEVHVEVDTGMTRTGFAYGEAVELIKKVVYTPGLKLGGVFSHFPVAESNEEFTLHQISIFKKIVEKLKVEGIKPPLFHIANSAGLLKYKDSHLDIVRPGLSLYGLVDEFEPIMSLKSRIVNLRQVKKGTGISYGLTYKTERESVIATISAGYGDGIPRSVSKKGRVLINGKLAPIAGVVCMDLFMVDVTDIDGVKLNGEVTIIGEGLSARDVAGWADTIVYELVTNIGPRVPRVFFESGRIVEIRDLLKRRYSNTGGKDEKTFSDRASNTPPIRSGAGTYSQDR